MTPPRQTNHATQIPSQVSADNGMEGIQPRAVSAHPEDAEVIDKNQKHGDFDLIPERLELATNSIVAWLIVGIVGFALGAAMMSLLLF